MIIHASFEGFLSKLASMAPKILIEASSDNEFEIVASGNDFEARVKIPVAGLNSKWNVLVAGKQLADIISASKRALDMTIETNALSFKGDGRRFSVPVILEPYSKPVFKQDWSSTQTLSYKEWRAAVLYAGDFTHLSHSVFSNIHIRNGYMYGTDSFRVGRANVALLNWQKCALPRHLLTNAIKLFDQANAQSVEVSRSSNAFRLTCGGVSFVGSQSGTANEFPELSNLFSPNNRHAFKVNRDKLVEALRFVAKDEREQYDVLFQFTSNNLTLKSGSLEADVEVKGGLSTDVYMHRLYILALIEHMRGDEVIIYAGKHDESFYITDSYGKEAILLPLNVI